MAGQLMTGIDHGGDRGGKGLDRVAGTNQVLGMPCACRAHAT